MKFFKRFVWSVIMLFLIFPHGFASAENNSKDKPVKQVVEENYHTVLKTWEKEGKRASQILRRPYLLPNS